MGIGPFDSLVFPGVYTQTLTQAPLASAAGELRIPAFIGVASDTRTVSNYEMIRGSSSMADNKIIKENVSSQVTGSNRNFSVSFFPIVKGDGAGTTTNDPKNIIAYINSNPVPVASLNGATGEIYLVNYPAVGDEVLITYAYKRTDTLHTDEDLSTQIDGLTRTFQTHFFPIVSGNNSGITTTDTSKITVKINGVTKALASLDGENGQFSLASSVTPPTPGDVITVTYYTNDQQNTADILPSPYVASVASVGYSPGASDFIQGQDYILDTTTSIYSSFSTLQWGNSLKVLPGATTSGYMPFNDMTGSLYDNHIYRRLASGLVDGTNKTFTLEYIPTDGQSRGKLTDDPSKLEAYVGTDPIVASPAVITEVIGSTRTIMLQTAPTVGQKVYVSQFQNNLVTDNWTVTCTGSGLYTIVGANSGEAMEVTYVDATVADSGAFSTEGVTYPDGDSANPNFRDTQVMPGSAVAEDITIKFIDATTYGVLSSVAGGTGSAGDNTCYLYQTYIDKATGFRITINQGATVDYSSNDRIHYNVSPTFHTTSLYRSRAIPGVKLIVSSTSGVNTSDTALINSYNLVNANEPNVGDFYYVTFSEYKQFDSNGIGDPVLYTQEKDMVADLGPLTIDNKLGLAGHLAFLNGAAAIVCLQIEKASGKDDAPDSRYISAIDVFNEPMTGGIRPTLIQPVTTSNAVLQYLRQSNLIQSGIRYGNEHRSYFGFPLNTSPTVAQAYARAMNNERMVAIYPDGAVITLTDALGNEYEYLVDGSLLASAFAGRDVMPAFDVAEPITRKPINGFTRLYRRMDSVTMAQTANAGITLLEETAGGIQVKFALTTNVENVLTRTPSIIRTKDFIQRGTRQNLNPYIGTKMLIQRLTEIEDTLNSYLASLQQAQIITAFQPAKATQDPSDPSIVNVLAYYSPVPELLWIVITFNIRTNV